MIKSLNAAVERGDIEAVSRLLDPDVVWEHNVGVGTIEEGVYRGRESVTRLIERILEPWERMRTVPLEIRDLGEGTYHVSGELHAKHATTEAEIVTPYEQHIETRDGRLVLARMTSDPRAARAPSRESTG